MDPSLPSPVSYGFDLNWGTLAVSQNSQPWSNPLDGGGCDLLARQSYASSVAIHNRSGHNMQPWEHTQEFTTSMPDGHIAFEMRRLSQENTSLMKEVAELKAQLLQERNSVLLLMNKVRNLDEDRASLFAELVEMTKRQKLEEKLNWTLAEELAKEKSMLLEETKQKLELELMTYDTDAEICELEARLQNQGTKLATLEHERLELEDTLFKKIQEDQRLESEKILEDSEDERDHVHCDHENLDCHEGYHLQLQTEAVASMPLMKIYADDKYWPVLRIYNPLSNNTSRERDAWYETWYQVFTAYSNIGERLYDVESEYWTSWLENWMHGDASDYSICVGWIRLPDAGRWVGVAGCASNPKKAKQALSLASVLVRGALLAEPIEIHSHREIIESAIEHIKRRLLPSCFHIEEPLLPLLPSDAEAKAWLDMGSIRVAIDALSVNTPSYDLDIPSRLLRFTQDNCSACFKNGRSVHETALMMWRQRIKLAELRINVVFENGCFWSLDNRRLATFKMLQSLSEHVIYVPCRLFKSHPQLRSKLKTECKGVGVHWSGHRKCT